METSDKAAKNDCQNNLIKRIEPPNWWVGMDSEELQLMIYGKEIASLDLAIAHPSIQVRKVSKVENSNYLFIDLLLPHTLEETEFTIHFSQNNKLVHTHIYPLLKRKDDSANRQGFDSGDAIYLLMPDRFSNGNPKIDQVDGMLESVDRKAPHGRHGGDLQGISNHLDYIQEMGFTSIWLNPVLENNQEHSSYHGYAITDFYTIDPRFGTNKEFKELSQECHKRGLKMIMDMVFNHCGSNHWWMHDLPMFSWINQWEEFTRSNYRLSTISDPYVAKADKDLSVKGWFDTHMPDLNLENKFLLTYMIQNSIWWIEYAGLQGIRMDTFPYPDQHGMAIWAQRILKEYPNFNIVGESWINEASKLCYWQKDFPNQDGYNSYLPSLMDFPMQQAIRHAFNEEESWSTGLVRLYNTLADDHLYPNPMNMVVFPDNHDEGRILHMLDNNTYKLKMALTYVLTTRGIPQIYYGTELLMNGNGLEGHDKIRLDFPGGWKSDSINGFRKQGRSKEQNQIFNHIKKLLNYRKKSNALRYGKTLHFIPEDGIYIYFRFSNTETVMVVLNNNTTGKSTILLNRFKEILGQYRYGTNILTGRKIQSLDKVTAKAKSVLVIELTSKPQ
ncbi:glycoside hydrolase family 13 protein [Labilibacter marinus]|uniref:glycoside hydrolase family 13 protein n=1 Tax=Labilibacter marinus TaxID=1477105 RepID=UPI00082DA257|nr:glycoside hydrolase family 13 protein [Labilibacter marinus]